MARFRQTPAIAWYKGYLLLNRLYRKPLEVQQQDLPILIYPLTGYFPNENDSYQASEEYAPGRNGNISTDLLNQMHFLCFLLAIQDINHYLQYEDLNL